MCVPVHVCVRASPDAVSLALCAEPLERLAAQARQARLEGLDPDAPHQGGQALAQLEVDDERPSKKVLVFDELLEAQQSFAGNGVAYFPSQGNDPQCAEKLCNIEKICDLMSSKFSYVSIMLTSRLLMHSGCCCRIFSSRCCRSE